MEKVYLVDGMSCQGCVKGITAAITQEIPDATVTVDLATKAVTVSPANDEAVLRAIDAAGFDYLGPQA